MTRLTTADRRLLTATCTAVIAVVGLSACAPQNSIGSGVNAKNTGNANLGSLTGSKKHHKTKKPKPTHSATTVVTHSAAPTTSAAAPATTHAVAPKTTTAVATQQVKAYMVTINADDSGKSVLDPPDVSVYTDTPITWTNKDTKPEGVEDAGVFKSPTLKPGQTYTWIPKKAGMFNYTVTGKPYDEGIIQVDAQ